MDRAFKLYTLNKVSIQSVFTNSNILENLTQTHSDKRDSEAQKISFQL